MRNANLALPDDWHWTKLSDVCEFIRGVSFIPSEAQSYAADSYVPILRAGNIGDFLDVFNDLIWVSPERVSPTQKLQLGDIAICLASGSPKVVGKSAQLKAPFDGSVGAFCGIIRPRTQLDANYLAHWLRSPDFLSWRDRQARGANIQNLRLSEFESLLVPLPPPNERGRIAALLDEQLLEVNRARVASEAQVQASNSLTLAQLREVFAGIRAQEWPWVKLGDVSEIVGGVQKTPGRAPINFHKPYMTVRNVQRGYLDLSEVQHFEITPAEFDRCRLHFGDILIVEGNGSLDQIGRNALFDAEGDDWIHQNHIIRVRIRPELHIPQFVSWFLNSDVGRQQMVEKAKTTSGLYTLSAGKVGMLTIPAPPVTIQWDIINEMATRVAITAKLVRASASQLSMLMDLPTLMLQRAFNGEL